MDLIHILLRQNVCYGGWECREWIVNTEQTISKDEIGLAYYGNQTGWDYRGYDTVCKDWTISLYVLDLMDSAVLGSIHVVFEIDFIWISMDFVFAYSEMCGAGNEQMEKDFVQRFHILMC